MNRSVLLVGPAVKADNFADFLVEAKSNPGEMTFGSAGNGSTPHLCGELLKLRTGIKARHIPFKGAGPALMALVGGQVSFQFENISAAIPQIQGGKVRALGVTSAERLEVLPDVPTIQELGIPDFVIGSWYGLSAPAGVAADAVQVLADATMTVLNDPAAQKQLAALGWHLSTLAPSAYKAFIASEIERWAPIIKASGARVD